MFKKMLNFYEEKSVANSYIIGFIVDGKIFFVKMDRLEENLLTEEKASRNQGTSIRVRIRKANKAQLMGRNPICLGNADLITDSKYNKGETFEKLVTEYYGQTWEKDNVPFYIDGDINVNGEKIQIKFENATLINSKQAIRMGMVA